MRAAKHSIAIAISITAIAWLLYSPLCNLSCALPMAEPLQQPEQPAHCHKKADSQKQRSSDRQSRSTPHRHDGSDNCASHADAALLPAARSNAPLDVAAQAQAVEPAAPLNVLFDEARSARDLSIASHSPPGRAVISVLRI
jgi:hypothetical protein